MPGGEDTYVYGVTRSGAGRKLPTAGVEGKPVRAVERGPLAALVSEAPDGPVKANRRNLMAHTEVLQQVMADGCVLPMQFGVVMPGESAVMDQLLAAHEPVLVEQLETFADVVELDLKVVCPEEALLRMLMAERPELTKLRESIRGKPEDATYFERIQLGEAVAGAVEQKREALLAETLRRLEPQAVSTAVSEPGHEQMLVNVAFLVQRDRLEAFDSAADALARDLGSEMRCRYTGPLPPFHFVEAPQGDGAWA